jgi:hypothetical protein
MSRTPVITSLLAGWLAALAGGWLFLDNRATPGAAFAAPPSWPADSTLTRAAGRPTLLLFAHPHCPCTRAGLDDLAWILARCEGADAAVVFVLPPGAPPDWQRGATWERARALPGVRLVTDRDGAEARRFGAMTSGHVMVYRAGGELAFGGGIAAPGAHAGRRIALAALRGEDVGEARRPEVFGCPLFDEE